MHIAKEMGGLTRARPTRYAKRWGRKIPEEWKKQRESFMKGPARRASPRNAQRVFEQIVHFGGYRFNKSHSTAYGLVAYQTLFSKPTTPPNI